MVENVSPDDGSIGHWDGLVLLVIAAYEPAYELLWPANDGYIEKFHVDRFDQFHSGYRP